MKTLLPPLVRVDLDRWDRGKGIGKGRMLTPYLSYSSDKCLCVIGYLLLSAGVPRHVLEAAHTVNDVLERCLYNFSDCPLEAIWFMTYLIQQRSEWLDTAISTNDAYIARQWPFNDSSPEVFHLLAFGDPLASVNEDDRRRALQAHFAQLGCELEFYREPVAA